MMTNTIKALLVDDEPSARENLHDLLTQFCPDIEIIGEAVNVDDAIEKIHSYKPDVVFLDIEMPRKSGFDLIRAFDVIDFYIVFVTAYDRYALRAFEVSAIDYLLKPIFIERLKEAVRKIAEQKEQKRYKKRFEALKTNTHSNVFKKLAIPYKNDYAIVNIEDIITIEADRMWSKLWVSDSGTKTLKKYTYSKELKYFEDIFQDLSGIQRVHRSWIVNTRHMESYSKKDRNILLKNDVIVPVSKGYKQTFEAFLGL